MKSLNIYSYISSLQIEYQSSAWSPLLQINCHKETQLFLCSLFAPVCVEQSPSTAIYPCRSLCESVKSSCEGPMLKYSYPWPEMFNCTKFPVDNGLCIKSSDNQVEATTKASTTTTTTITTTLTTTTNTARQVEASTPIAPKAPKTGLRNAHQCFGCEDTDLDMVKLVRSYCKADVVFRGRIQSIKISKLTLSKHGQDLQNARNKSVRPMASLYVRVGKRDRKIVKGAEMLAPKTIREYLSEHGRSTPSSKDLDVFIMSKYHLNAVGLLGNGLASKPLRRAKSNNSPMKRFSDFGHCTCESLKNNPMRFKTKYFMMANILKTKSLTTISGEEEEESVSENLSYSKRYLLDYFTKKLTRQVQHESKSKSHGRVQKLIYLSSLVKWNKARPFIDYLEDDTIQKGDICSNVKRTVAEINKAHARLF